MATLSQAKSLGGIGSILIFIPFVSIIGYILLIIGIKDISDELRDRAIFNNIVVSAVTGIVGAVAGASVVAFGMMASGFTFGPSGVTSLFSGLFIAWVFLIISAVFLRKAYDTMGGRLGVGSFRTAATLYLVGAVLTIVFIGFLILFIAEIVQAVAFFSIPEELPGPSIGGVTETTAFPTVSGLPLTGESSKFCTSCGTKISPTATFCYKCGSKQP